MKRAFAFRPLLALAAALSGCGGNPLAPAKDLIAHARGIRVTVDLTLSSDRGSPGHPVTIRADVANRGSAAVYVAQDCFSVVPEILVLAPDGDPLMLYDPTALGLGCPSGFGPFAPGASAERSFEFTGDLYTRSGQRYDAPPGVYTAILGFHYSTSASFDGGDWQTVERARSFSWNLP